MPSDKTLFEAHRNALTEFMHILALPHIDRTLTNSEIAKLKRKLDKSHRQVKKFEKAMLKRLKNNRGAGEGG